MIEPALRATRLSRTHGEGDITSRRTVVCSGTVMSITANCYDVLRTLHFHLSKRPRDGIESLDKDRDD